MGLGRVFQRLGADTLDALCPRVWCLVFGSCWCQRSRGTGSESEGLEGWKGRNGPDCGEIWWKKAFKLNAIVDRKPVGAGHNGGHNGRCR